MLAVVITGPPGAGKTSVLTALADALSDDNVPHAAVEAEALRWAHPGHTDEQEMRHLKAVCALYREAGHALMLIGQTIETDDNLAQLLDAVGADESFVVKGSVDLVLSTEGQRPEAVAECIRQALPDELIAPAAPQT